jgi:hypothetical protein
MEGLTDRLDSDRKVLFFDSWIDWSQIEGLTDGLDSERRFL